MSLQPPLIWKVTQHTSCYLIASTPVGFLTFKVWLIETWITLTSSSVVFVFCKMEVNLKINLFRLSMFAKISHKWCCELHFVSRNNTPNVSLSHLITELRWWWILPLSNYFSLCIQLKYVGCYFGNMKLFSSLSVLHQMVFASPDDSCLNHLNISVINGDCLTVIF